MSADGQTNTVVAFSGTRNADPLEDNGPALSAGGNPYTLCYDKTHDILYAVCGDQYVVRAIDSAGTITSALGVIGSQADVAPTGGPAASANVWNMAQSTADTTGNLYVMQTIRAHVGVVDYANKNWNNFLGVYGSGGYSGDGGQATLALLGNPGNMWADSTHYVYVSDEAGRGMNLIR
eukprot:gene24450-30796_t